MRIFLLLTYFIKNLFEGLRTSLGELGEDLAIETYVCDLESIDELGVGRAFCANSCVDTDLPDAASLTLLVAAVCKCIGTSVGDGVFGHAFLGGAAETVPLHLGENVLAALIGYGSSFYSCHILNVMK